MLFPYKIIESKISSRKQFDVVDGYQPTHALLYIKEGCFSMEIDGISETVQKGDCIILPDYIHFRRSVLNPIEFIYIKFAENQSCPYFFEVPYGKAVFKDKKRFLSSITAIEKLIVRDDSLSAACREHLLMDILFQLYLEKHELSEKSDEYSSHDTLVSQSAKYITENLSRKILIEDICTFCGTNASTLNFKYRREFGLSVGKYIIKERIKKAKHLLISTTYSISEIAERCGFENVYYFSNAFKKSEGVSPSAYRS